MVRIFEQTLGRIVAVIVRLCELLTVAIGGWLMVVLVASVFFRFVLNSSLTWVDETSALLLVCLMLAVAPIGFHEYIHISVDVLLNRLPRRARSVLGIFINLCAMLLFAVTGYFGIFMVIDDFGTQMSSVPIMQGWFTGFLPIACLFVLIVCAHNILQIVRLGDIQSSTEDVQ